MDVFARLRRPHAPAEPEELRKRLEKADRMIDLAWSIAMLWAVLRLVGAFMLWRHTAQDDVTVIADPLLIAALAYGLYRRSRVCAILLLAYVVIELRLVYTAQNPTAGITVAFILGLTFAQGIRGVYTYRRELAEAAQS